MTKFWELTAAGTEDADLYIFGDIDSRGSRGNKDNRNASEIVSALRDLKAKNLTVHINSYGGDVKEGLAIYNTIKNSGLKVTTICDGFACSIASVIFMAGENRIMNEASLLMIHNPWTIAIGNAEEMRKQADDLDIIAQASVEAYKANSCLLDDEIHQLMDKETWILPEQAVEYGFATEINKKSDDGLQQSAIRQIIEKLTAKPAANEQRDTAEKQRDAEFGKKLDSIEAKFDALMAAISKDKPAETKKAGFNSIF
jgi:ATP-dependent Clp protease protease subunit